MEKNVAIYWGRAGPKNLGEIGKIKKIANGRPVKIDHFFEKLNL